MEQEEIQEAQDYLEKNIAYLLKKVTVDLLVNKPKYVVSHMIKFLEKNG